MPQLHSGREVHLIWIKKKKNLKDQTYLINFRVLCSISSPSSCSTSLISLSSSLVLSCRTPAPRILSSPVQEFDCIISPLLPLPSVMVTRNQMHHHPYTHTKGLFESIDCTINSSVCTKVTQALCGSQNLKRLIKPCGETGLQQLSVLLAVQGWFVSWNHTQRETENLV